ncbi:hypothetical protein M0R72_06935 [Candidatus Pacearchaeota archaeon]|jgi:hypothetical protein|nr:hypothetical protein [Candidatus Pacearchaeota archaeon]
MTEISIPVPTDFPKVKNNTINYLGELFELVMGELITSNSRHFGAGFLKFDSARAKAILEEQVMPLLDKPATDTPVLAAIGDQDEDIKSS